MTLTPQSSQRWMALHVVLVPVFPLLGGCVWLVLGGERGVVAGIARAAAFVYGSFYGALDAINGVATGALVAHASSAGAAEQGALGRPVVDLGNALGWVGSSAFLLATLAVIVVAIRRCGSRALPGALVLAVAAVSFLDSHIYWPRGVLTMAAMAVGLVLLSRALEGAAPRSNG